LIKAYDALKINQRIGNYQIHKNPSQAEEGMGNKNLILWFSLFFQEKRTLIIHKYL